jgi:hypothetical protein
MHASLVGWRGGISPPRSHGSERDSLPSFGSYHPAARLTRRFYLMSWLFPSLVDQIIRPDDPTPSLHRHYSASTVSGRRRRPARLASVRRSNPACSFPVLGFHKGCLYGKWIDGISDISFTRPISPYRIVSGSSFQPVFRQRLRLCDHIRRTIHRSKRLKSLRIWALQ